MNGFIGAGATMPPIDAPRPAMDADELARATGGRLLRRSSRPIRGAAVDSRLVRDGELFVALPGARTDGHRFLRPAAAAGAAALIVSRPPEPTDLEDLGEVTILLVPDTLRAFHAVAAAWRARFTPLVIGVTGSIAKTSTKEAIAAVFATRRRTLRSEGNLNNEVGLPLTVLRLGPEHEVAVLEMGMYVGGEIADLARIARPRIGVVTAVHGVHLSRIGTIEAVEAAKAELVEALPADGTAVLNADDPRVARMAGRTPARSITYGFAEEADVGAEAVRSAGLAGMRFTLRVPGRTGGSERREAATPCLGRLSVHNGLAAAAAALAAGLDLDAILEGLSAGWAAPHRAEVVRAGDVCIVDDTYNASPGSMGAALELLGGLPGRRIAVLGEMLELGEAAEAGHLAAGASAAVASDLLFVVGRGAAGIATGAVRAGMDPARVLRVPDVAAALDALRPRLAAGDVVLVKASRGIALETLVDALAAECRGIGGPAR